MYVCTNKDLYIGKKLHLNTSTCDFTEILSRYYQQFLIVHIYSCIALSIFSKMEGPPIQKSERGNASHLLLERSNVKGANMNMKSKFRLKTEVAYPHGCKK